MVNPMLFAAELDSAHVSTFVRKPRSATSHNGGLFGRTVSMATANDKDHISPCGPQA